MFDSRMIETGSINLPTLVPSTLYMHEVDVNGEIKMPSEFRHWEDTVAQALQPVLGQVDKAYVTIDQKQIVAGDTHRRAGAHIDNIWYPAIKAHGSGGHGGGGGGGGHGKLSVSGRHGHGSSSFHDDRGGIILASNYQGCEAWVGKFDAIPGEGGDCEHIRDQLVDGVVLEPNKMYLLNSTCIHESLPIQEDVLRTLMRVSLPKEYVSS